MCTNCLVVCKESKTIFMPSPQTNILDARLCSILVSIHFKNLSTQSYILQYSISTIRCTFSLFFNSYITLQFCLDGRRLAILFFFFENNANTHALRSAEIIIIYSRLDREINDRRVPRPIIYIIMGFYFSIVLASQSHPSGTRHDIIIVRPRKSRLQDFTTATDSCIEWFSKPKVMVNNIIIIAICERWG